MNASSVVPFAELANKDFITPGFGPGERDCPFWTMAWTAISGASHRLPFVLAVVGALVVVFGLVEYV